MNFRTRTVRAAALALVAATAATTGLVFSSIASADAPTTPPWQVGGSVDPNKVGTLKFFDASGTEVFGGSTTAPLAAYVQASSAVRANDNSANLYLYTPVANKQAGDWSGSLITASGQYPVASPPGSVSASLPVYKTTAADTKLADYLSSYPNTSSATGYQGAYELRLRTAKAGADITSSTGYAVADIVVTGNTWAVYGSGAVKTDSTTTAVVPGTSTYGNGFQVTATVTGAETPVGNVTLKDGAATVGSPVALDGSGHATFNVSGTALAGGVHNLSVAYPGSATLNQSASVPSAITVAKATTTTTVAPPAKATYGTAFKVSATVASPAGTPTGTVTLKSGSTVVGTATLASGKATFTVPATKLAPGTRPFTATYNTTASFAASTSAAKNSVVGKAVAKLTNVLSPKTIKHTKAAKLTVTVKVTGVVPTGTIKVYDGTKLIKSATLAAAKKGKLVITLPKRAKGSHKIHAVYSGSTLVLPATGAKVALKST